MWSHYETVSYLELTIHVQTPIVTVFLQNIYSFHRAPVDLPWGSRVLWCALQNHGPWDENFASSLALTSLCSLAFLPDHQGKDDADTEHRWRSQKGNNPSRSGKEAENFHIMEMISKDYRSIPDQTSRGRNDTGYMQRQSNWVRTTGVSSRMESHPQFLRGEERTVSP